MNPFTLAEQLRRANLPPSQPSGRPTSHWHAVAIKNAENAVAARKRDERVRQAIAQGIDRPAAIRDHLGCSKADVFSSLVRLIAAGKIRKIKPGMYALPKETTQ